MAKQGYDYLAVTEARLDRELEDVVAKRKMSFGHMEPFIQDQDGNRRQKSKEPEGQAYIFRKIRLGDGTTVLEPLAESDPTKIKINEGDQFVTGWLNADPGWTAVKK